MLRVNDTVFKFCMVVMDSLSEFLSERYADRTLNDSRHYQTIIIKKIVQMFHTLKYLTKETTDEVSARCLLRGILDGITTYSFIYKRENDEEVLFRHYLYILDGWREYKKSVLGISEENENKLREVCCCDYVIEQIENQLRSHSYYFKDECNVEKLIKDANWKFLSLQKTDRIKYGEMYKEIGFDESTSEYFKSYLSQFAHGLCLSNRHFSDHELMKKVLDESFVLAYQFIRAIFQSFHDNDMMNDFLSSIIFQQRLKSEDLNFDDLYEFVLAIVRKDIKILI